MHRCTVMLKMVMKHLQNAAGKKAKILNVLDEIRMRDSKTVIVRPF